MQVDILAIFAHPDDVELTVGGTLLKMKEFGYRTGALDVTRGEMGTRGTVESRGLEAEDFRPCAASRSRPLQRPAGSRIFQTARSL